MHRHFIVATFSSRHKTEDVVGRSLISLDLPATATSCLRLATDGLTATSGSISSSLDALCHVAYSIRQDQTRNGELTTTRRGRDLQPTV